MCGWLRTDQAMTPATRSISTAAPPTSPSWRRWPTWCTARPGDGAADSDGPADGAGGSDDADRVARMTGAVAPQTAGRGRRWGGGGIEGGPDGAGGGDEGGGTEAGGGSRRQVDGGGPGGSDGGVGSSGTASDGTRGQRGRSAPRPAVAQGAGGKVTGPYGQAPIVQRPRTPPFQGGNTGSNPVGGAPWSAPAARLLPRSGRRYRAQRSWWRWSLVLTIGSASPGGRPPQRSGAGVRGPVVQFGVHAGLSSRRSRVQIPSGPLPGAWPCGAGAGHQAEPATGGSDLVG